MELKDLIISPIVLGLVVGLAYWLRANKSDEFTNAYFFPAFWLKILGAVSVGLIYQFYYSGGDTFNYYHHGSTHIYEAFLDHPIKAFKLITAQGEYAADTYEYAKKIWFYRDSHSYFVIRIAGIFSLFTFNTYSSIAILFAFYSFLGLWAMYRAFMRFYPELHREFAIAIFFIPSVFFWGSGLLKDTLTLGALAFLTYGFIRLFFENRGVLIPLFIILISAYIIYSIKIYILLCFLPAMILWLFIYYLKFIPSKLARISISPLVLGLATAIMYFAVLKVGEENKRYNLDSISYTAEATARWLSYVSETEGGSGYTLGDYDYSPAGIARKFPKAVWVSLFRPYLWEVKNPVMLLSALEAVFLLFFTLYLMWQSGLRAFFRHILAKPEVLFCFVFSIAFAGAVGITTYNFGSLVRYKIPMIPFFLMGLFLIRFYWTDEKSNKLLNESTDDEDSALINNSSENPVLR